MVLDVEEAHVLRRSAHLLRDGLALAERRAEDGRNVDDGDFRRQGVAEGRFQHGSRDDAVGRGEAQLRRCGCFRCHCCIQVDLRDVLFMDLYIT